MSKYGVNVPKGAAVASVDEVKRAIQDVFPKESEVIIGNHGLFIFRFILTRRQALFYVADQTEKKELFIAIFVFFSRTKLYV